MGRENRVSYRLRPMTLAERIKTARLYAELSQEDLAELTGLKQPTISGLESGRYLGSRFLYKIAVACKVSIGWLDSESGPMVIPETEEAREFQELPQDDQRDALAVARLLRERERR